MTRLTRCSDGRSSHSRKANWGSSISPIGEPRKTGSTGLTQHGEIRFAATPGGDRPVLVLTRDPVADRIGSIVDATLTRTRRGLVSELELTAAEDGVPTDCVANLDNIHTIPRDAFRRMVVKLRPVKLIEACQTMLNASGCESLHPS